MYKIRINKRFKPLNLLIKLLALLSPPGLLTAQSIDQRRSIRHLSPARFSVINQCLLVAHCLIVFCLYQIQLTLFFVQLCLRFIKLARCFL